VQPHLSGQRIRRLIVLATAVLIALLAPIAPAAVASAAAPAAPAWLDPSAGWHGRRSSAPRPPHRRSAPPRPAARPASCVGEPASAGSPAQRPSGACSACCTASATAPDRSTGASARAPGPPSVGSTTSTVSPPTASVGPATLSHLNRRARQGGRPQLGRGTPATQPQQERESQRQSGTGGDSQAQTPPAATPRPQAQQPQEQEPRPQADTEPPATATEPRPNGDAADPNDAWLVAALAVLAILGAILATVLLRRRRRARPEEGTAISLTEPPWVVGRSADPAIGEFAGMATALHVSPPMSGSSSAAAVRYCVIDDRRKIPFWVAADEITESRKPNGTEHHVPEDLPYRDLAEARPAAARFSRPGARPRRRGTIGRRVPGSDQPVAGRISWLRSLGMPPESIADLVNDQRVPPPPSVAAWTAEAVVEAADHRQERSPAGGRRR